MALYKHFDYVWDLDGVPLPGVQVRLENADETPVSIYNDKEGNDPVGFVTTAALDAEFPGAYQFFVAPGEYVLVIDDGVDVKKIPQYTFPSPESEVFSLLDVWRGAWDVAANYLAGELVERSGTSYIALSNNTGQDPSVSPLVWDVVSAWGNEEGVELVANRRTDFSSPDDTSYPTTQAVDTEIAAQVSDAIAVHAAAGDPHPGYVLESTVGAASGVAPLGADSKIAAVYLPSFVDDVLEYANLAAFPAEGEAGKIYVAIDTGNTYRWGGTLYVEISASPGSTDAVPEGVVNLYFTNARAAAAAPVQSVAGRTGAVVLVMADVTDIGTAAALASDTDAALAADSDARVATQKATKAYADGKLGGSTGATDNKLLRSDGGAGKTAQATGITVDDDDRMYGHGSLVNDYADSGNLALTDAGAVARATKATAMTLTVPPQSSVAWKAGTQIGLVQYGAGQLTIAAGSGVTIRSSGGKLKLTGQYSGAVLLRLAADEWVLTGDLTA